MRTRVISALRAASAGFSAVLIVIQLVVNMVCMANDLVSMVLSVGIAMFLCAPVYMLAGQPDRQAF